MLVCQKRNVLIIYRIVASVETQRDPVEQQLTDAHLQYNTSLLIFFFCSFVVLSEIRFLHCLSPGGKHKPTADLFEPPEIPEKSGSPVTIKREITRTTKMKAIIHPARFSKPEYPPVHLSLHTKTQKFQCFGGMK